MLVDFVRKWRETPAAFEPPTEALPVPEKQIPGIYRNLSRCEAPPIAKETPFDLERFRQTMNKVVRDYMATPDPDYMLLIPAPPGAGKTWTGVHLAHWVFEKMHRRVLYAGPRHEFFQDVINISPEPERWTEWLPRQQAKDDYGEGETCKHTPAINAWMQRGYKAMDFCERICRWDYIKNDCPYHAQGRKAQPLIFGQHAHVVLGHTLAHEFGVVVGDEIPLSSFVWEWDIPTRHIRASDLEYTEPLSEIVRTLQRLAENGSQLHGMDLINVLGGAESVLKSCELANLPFNAIAEAPSIYRPEDAHDKPYFYLPALVFLLQREAEAVRRGIEDYPTRIWLRPSGLTLLLRRYVNERMPKHMIWFDATGTSGIYEAMFKRKVRLFDATPQIKGRIYQVTDRANGKSTLKDKEGNESRRAQEVKAQVDRICEIENATNPAVITYMELTGKLDRPTGHFYGNRGTNQFEKCDVLVVAGTPLPPLYQIEKIAKSLWIERMAPFDSRFRAIDRRYNYIDENGDGWAYPTPVFADHELNEILWQYREAEIIQSAHRARILTQNKPVYLLTNVPIDELPPTKLLTIRELMGAPEGVNAFKWEQILNQLEQLDREREGGISLKDIQEIADVHENTARKYRDLLMEKYGWKLTKREPTGRGQPPSVVTLAD